MAKDLRAQLRAVELRVQEQINDKIRKAAEVVGEELVEESKVYSGLFAANWRPGINMNSLDALDHPDLGVSKQAAAQNFTAERLISQAKAINEMRMIPEFDLGDVITFTNSVPYLLDFKDPNPWDTIDAGVDNGIIRANQEINK